MRSEPLVRFDALGPQSAGAAKSYRFVDCVEQVQADDPAQVAGVLDRVERWAHGGGHAAGFVSYEAATALEPAATVHPNSTIAPLVWFGLFRRRVEIEPLTQLDSDAEGGYELAPLRPTLDLDSYTSAIDKVQDYIAAGDSYQVNLTQRLRGTVSGDVRELYADMCLNQRAAYCALIELEDLTVLSASPELFFAMRDGELYMRPMKGTRRRGRWLEEDEQMASSLMASAKDRAENVMIVDLIRNDLGRVSQTGSVTVEDLWELECYQTVWQMTSGVRARCRPDVSLAQLFAALFPSGSVTGAPKIRTMEIIVELEDSSRGIYTGAIGFVSPPTADHGGSATGRGVTSLESVFNVAIRTACIDSRTGIVESGVGGGITHYSNAQDEYDEALLKARFWSLPVPRGGEFQLLETLLLCTEEGYFLLDRHLRRLQASADYFAFSCSVEAVEADLLEHSASLTAGHHRVRLTLSAAGEAVVTSRPLEDLTEAEPWPVRICGRAVDRGDVFLYHKTTRRTVYEERLADHPDCRDVILCNEAGEVTECSIGNLVLDMDGSLLTPARSSGLLAGTFREHLLEADVLRECVLSVADVQEARRVFMINSVRKWVELSLVDADRLPSTFAESESVPYR